MKFKFLVITYLVLLLTTRLYSQNFESYQEFYQAFTNMEVDPNTVLDVNSVMLTKDIGNFSLDSGKIYFLKPIGGRVIGAVFIGNGSFTFTPPLLSEKIKLQNVLECTTLIKSFTTLTMLFGDDTFEQLKSEYPLYTRIIDRKVPELINSLIKYICNKDNEEINVNLCYTFLNNKKNSQFYAKIDDNLEPLIWQISPYNEEEVSLGKGNSTIITKWEENICRFHKENDIDDSIPKLDRSITYLITDYDLNCNFLSSDKLSVKTTLNVVSKDSNLRWICMILNSYFNVNLVKTSTNINLDFFKNEKSDRIWIKLDKNYKIDEKLSIIIEYKTELLDLADISYYSNFYPTNLFNYRSKHNFHTRFSFSRFWELVSVGKKLFDSTYEDIRVVEYRTEFPVDYISYVYTSLNLKKIDTTDIPKINYYYEDPETTDQILSDIIHSYRFYQNIFGKIPLDQIDIATYGRSSFPGFIKLSSVWHVNTGWVKGYQQTLIPEQISHQWWGVSVKNETYRDSWIIESITEYSSLLFVQNVLKDNEIFFKDLSDKKDRLLSSHDYNKKDPILSSKIPLSGGISFRSYLKGTWVLHMIRNLMLDMNKMNEDQFYQMLKELFTTFQGKYISNKGFQNIVEKYLGYQMDWFFNQWVNGNQIPKYTFGYKTELTPEGKYKVICKIKQEDADEEFFMIVPIKIDFGENRYYSTKLKVTGKMTEIQLPLLPMEPKKIEFNALESVLCDYKTDVYDDIK